MSKIMLINVTHAEESRVAIVADGTLVSFEIESCNREHLKGNIYKGVVQRVQPGLEAAFVDIGAERNAFLPLDEICFRHLPQPVRMGTNGERRKPRIQDILKPGDQLLVQIAKEQFGSKPPTLTTFYSLPGRFLVLLPGSDESGISRRIEGADRVRVRELVEKLHPPEGYGIIVRTVVGYDPGLADLQRDLTYLLRLWESIQHSAAQKSAPALVYREHDLVLRNIRDYFTPDIDEIYVDNEEVFERARQFLRDVLPEKEGVLRLYRGDKPIFSQFNIESQIESIYKRRVPLKSGGYIVIDGTEALTAIDVNSGRALRGANQEETAFRTNLEAAVEIARQLRLRDLGGLIVIDFIDMRNPQHITEVEKALRAAMFEDKARHEIGRISHFGLLEVSRQRLRPAATATTYVTCPMCDGYGLVRTTESAALVALRKVHNRVAQGDVESLRVALPPEMAMYLLNQKREDLAQLERRYNVKITVVPKAELMPHECEIETKTRSVTQVLEAATPTQLASVKPQEFDRGIAGLTSGEPASREAEAMAPAVDETLQQSAGGSSIDTFAVAENLATKQGKRKRRRGRRRGKGRLAAAALQEALSSLAARFSVTLAEVGAAEISASTNRGDTSSDVAVGFEATGATIHVPQTTESAFARAANQAALGTEQVAGGQAPQEVTAAREKPVIDVTVTTRQPPTVEADTTTLATASSFGNVAGAPEPEGELTFTEGEDRAAKVEASSEEPLPAAAQAASQAKRGRRARSATSTAARKPTSTSRGRARKAAASSSEVTASGGGQKKKTRAAQSSRSSKSSKSRGAAQGPVKRKPQTAPSSQEPPGK
ncbi:MAG: ribonuclease E [Candidatus Binatia bacterium]|nr:MAG: ribonuclease E [Candidatus Binatia bacterium]